MYLLDDRDYYQCPGDQSLPPESSESCYRRISKEEAIELYAKCPIEGIGGVDGKECTSK